MQEILNDLEKGLTIQLSNLTSEIRAAEEGLLRSKEGYLKIQGALEILEIVSNRIAKQEQDDIKDAIVGIGAD
jgi:hypothetical protein